MRHFFQSHWKVILALLVLILVAAMTIAPDTASATSDLAERMRRHVHAVASDEHGTRRPDAPERAAVRIEAALQEAGYQPARQEYTSGSQRVRKVEAALANVKPGERPARIFIVGAHYNSAQGVPDANDHGGGTAAVLELARLLRTMRPAAGTEVRFVFFVIEELPRFLGEEMGGRQPPPGLEGQYPDTGNFIAFVGTLESSALVRQALSAFRAASDGPAEGLAAPAHMMGVTLSDHASYHRQGYPALMITDTAFLRYPYYHTAQDTPEQLDYEGMARVVEGLAKTIAGLAGAAQG